MTTAESEKEFKQAEHRRERAHVRDALRKGDEPPHPKAFGNPWAGDKDGKQWLAAPPDELLRK
jgi:hypothetical protein